MSVRVIFSLEFAEQLKESHDSNGNPFRSFKGVRISVDPDAIYGYLGSDVENVTMNPLFPSEFITGFSARVYVITSYLRTMGRYEFVTAVGYVSDTSKGTPGGRSPGYWLNIEASSLEDLKSLYDQILAGTIRPTVSYEAEQIGPAKSWLQALYHRFVPRSA